MSPSSNFYRLSAKYQRPPHFQNFLQDIVGFVLHVQPFDGEVVLCVFKSVELAGECWNGFDVISLNRQVSSSSSLPPSVRVFDAGAVAYPGGQDSERPTAPFFDVYTLFLVFILEHEKVRERCERIGARCDR